MKVATDGIESALELVVRSMVNAGARGQWAERSACRPLTRLHAGASGVTGGDWR